MFAHWGDDMEVLNRLFSFLADHGFALIFRMHDRNRFEASYIDQLQALASRNPHVLFKYKDDSQDNLIDIAISDLMISNYSSILTFFYATGRPTIHVYPVDHNAQESVYRYWKRGKVHAKSKEADYIWSLDAKENGGWVVASQDELESAILRAIQEPDSCAERARRFVVKHCAAYDQNNCERIAAVVQQMGERVLSHSPKKGVLSRLLGR